jgi:hypothetical protein
MYKKFWCVPQPNLSISTSEIHQDCKIVYLDYDQVLNQEIDFEKHNIHKESFTHQSI